MEENTCPICGERTSSYMGHYRKDQLCRKHATEFKEGKIEQCPDCGTWHATNEQCPCKNKPANTNSNRIVPGETCIVCGAPSNGYFFCKSCYGKYKNKAVIIKFKNCTDIEIIDSGYESKITCEDGHPVKSQQEAMIDNYLFTHNIKHIYEKEFSFDGKKEHVLHPDFYLPDLDVYIEHFGITGNTKYEESKEYKLPIYEKAGITLICTSAKDIQNLSGNLERKLQHFEKGKINFLDE